MGGITPLTPIPTLLQSTSWSRRRIKIVGNRLNIFPMLSTKLVMASTHNTWERDLHEDWKIPHTGGIHCHFWDLDPMCIMWKFGVLGTRAFGLALFLASHGSQYKMINRSSSIKEKSLNQLHFWKHLKKTRLEWTQLQARILLFCKTKINRINN